jgi:hypothetical protein
MNSDIHDIITASYIACAGPYQAQWYTERAKSQGIATNIIITGLPQYDRLANANRDRDHACRIMNINPKQPVVTYAASWRQDTSLLGCYDGDNEAFMLFLAAAKQLPDVQFVVRTHPNASNVDWHIQQIKESSIPMLVLPGVHLDTNLNATDMLISYGPSNIILEAACVPDIRLAIIGDPAGFPGDSEVVKLPMDADSIAATIQSELSNETCDMSQFVLKYMGPNDGKARHRIVQLVKELVP